jgi:hypothetical protein
MLRLIPLLISSIPVQAVELLRDRHGSEEYIFEADQTEMTATVDAAEAQYVPPTGLRIFTKIFSISKTANFGTNQFDSG